VPKLWIAALPCLLLLAPAVAGDHLQEQVVTRACVVKAGGQDVASTCDYYLQHSVTKQSCNLATCRIKHTCIVTLYGHLAESDYLCGDEAGALAVAPLASYAYASRTDADFLAPLGTCYDFTVSGSARAPVVAGTPVGTTGSFAHTISVCA
jgi:hypothetical protein